ncbi:MAG: protein-arginine kinase activator protein McsA [Glaciecola sp.]|jgi:protein-arginine kinase activator protein McsA
MGRLEEIRSELNALQDELKELDSDDFMERARVRETQRDLRAEASAVRSGEAQTA